MRTTLKLVKHKKVETAVNKFIRGFLKVLGQHIRVIESVLLGMSLLITVSVLNI
jgi:hypothetical protein